MPRVVAYLRVSTDRQERRGSSLSSQERACRLYCELKGLDLVEVIRERVSGRKETLERPGLLRALDALDTGKADGLVVWALDRFARNVHSATELIHKYFGEGRDFQLHVTTEEIDTRTAAGRLTLHVKLAVAQYEAEKTAERIRTVKRFLKDEGYYAGGEVPYGYRVSKRIRNPHGKSYRKLEPDPHESRVMELVRIFRRKGLSLREVASALDNEGLTTRTGRPWHPEQVRRILATKK